MQNDEFIMRTYRQYILGIKRRGFVNYDRNGKPKTVRHPRVARSLVHYKDFIRLYLKAKRSFLQRTKSHDHLEAC